jgi:uncharacterized protein YndB with AHSA1/START domain
MKKVKIILGIISVIALVFFATGAFIKETSYTIQIAVNKPIGQVFDAFNNVENKQKWISELESVKVINENIGKTGSEYQLIIENQGQKLAISEKVLAYIPNEKLTLFHNAQNMLKTNDYVFNESNGLTNITLHATCRSDSYLMSCLFPYFKGTFKNQDLSYLTNFKAFVEQ